MKRTTVLVSALVLLAGTGCAMAADPQGLPGCDAPPNGFNSQLVLMAQAVPTASQVPCLRSVPIGWEFTGVQARSGRARFQLVANRAEQIHDVWVEVRDSCDVTGAAELTTLQGGIERYERIETGPGYAGERYHVYEGGCTTYRFNLPGGTTGMQTLDTVANSLDFVSRVTLRRQVFDRSDGRLHLDPRPEPAT